MCSTEVTAFGKDFSFLQNIASNDSIKLCIYGCGLNGEIICQYLRELGKEIEFFVDRQADNRDFSVLGKKVIPPQSFFKMKRDIKVVISPDNHRHIIQFLLDNGIKQENIISPFKRVDKEIIVLNDDYDPEQFISKGRKKEFTKPEVTIFTILYNTPRGMLCRTIESVLNQSFENFTYLIIDNGSTDDSADIIRKYMEKDKRITYIRLAKNVPWTHKEMLTTLKDNIKPPYVAMVDSDDYYEPEFLEKTIMISRRDNSDIVQVNTFTYGHEGFKYSFLPNCFGENVCAEEKDKEKYFLLRILSVTVWGKLYNSELFKGFIDMMLSYETEYERDRNFCLDVSWITYMTFSCNRVSICDEALHVRTWRPGSSEHSDDHSSKWLSSLVWAFRYLRKSGVDYAEAQVFEEVALMWLFSLNRDKYTLSKFRENDLSDQRVSAFLSRPICDKYRRTNEF